MPLDPKAIEVLNRPLSDADIKVRDGKAGLKFKYVSPDFVIRALNEAFHYQWDTEIVAHAVHDGVAVVGLRLQVPTEDGQGRVFKEQFGSCEITRGLGVGEAFKGAASDALKKCATLFGLALELYEDKDTGDHTFRPPVSTPNKNSFQGTSSPKPPAAPAPPRFQASIPAPKSPSEVPAPSRPMSPPPFPPKPPTTPPAVKKQANPFLSNGSGEINATQLNSLTNIATRKNLTQSELIALAGITDGDGRPVSSFEELKYDQAIAVIQAAQR